MALAFSYLLSCMPDLSRQLSIALSQAIVSSGQTRYLGTDQTCQWT